MSLNTLYQRNNSRDTENHTDSLDDSQENLKKFSKMSKNAITPIDTLKHNGKNGFR